MNRQILRPFSESSALCKQYVITVFLAMQHQVVTLEKYAKLTPPTTPPRHRAALAVQHRGAWCRFLRKSQPASRLAGLVQWMTPHPGRLSKHDMALSKKSSPASIAPLHPPCERDGHNSRIVQPLLQFFRKLFPEELPAPSNCSWPAAPSPSPYHRQSNDTWGSPATGIAMALGRTLRGLRGSEPPDRKSVV